MSKYFYFDIETGPRTDALDFIGEITASRTLKDPVKIAADIESKRLTAIENAALSPITGKIIAYSYAWDNDAPEVCAMHGEQDESMILDEIRCTFAEAFGLGYSLVGYNIRRFDIPFIMRRMMVNRMAWKSPVIRTYHGKPSLDDAFIDVLDYWKLGADDHGNGLSNVAKLLGLGEKFADGSQFSKMLMEDRPKALEYCRQDIIKTREVWNSIKLSCAL